MFRIASGISAVSFADHGAVSAPAPAPAPVTALDADDVMRLVYANHTRPTLHKDVWGEVAKFATRHDVLNLRCVSTDIGKWVDRSITSLTVNADQAPVMLAAMRSAANLKHVRSLQIDSCTYRNIRVTVHALAALSHAMLDVALVRHRYEYLLDAFAVDDLSAIAPASLRLINFGTMTVEEARVLARLHYPIHLSSGPGQGGVHDNRLRALADIPQLISLNVMVCAVEDTAAQAFGAHPTLIELRLNTHGSHRIVISDSALIALAHSVTLRTLHLGRIHNQVGEEAIAALAANRSLEYLCLGGPDDVFDASAALALSTNTTLKTLHISLDAGIGHLARMAALEHLFISGKVSLDDARQFAGQGHLKALNGYRCQFAPGALAVIASCPIQDIALDDPVGNAIPVLTEEDIDAFMGNRTLRSLLLVLPIGPNSDIAQAIRLAGHPTLESLSIRYLCVLPVGAARAEVDLTFEERAILAANWGTHRSREKLSVTIA